MVKKYKVYLLDNNNLSNKFGLNNILDKNKYFLAKISISFDYALYYFSVFSNLVSISLGSTKKVLITDLDNTLWGGILGDDGMQGIETSLETPLGNAHGLSKIFKKFEISWNIARNMFKNSYENVEEFYKIKIFN